MGENDWVIKANNELENMADASTESEHWKKQSIYKVPVCIRDLNKKAYKPQIVSFGPYHYGEPQVKPMEEHKHRALLHFLKRSKKNLQDFLVALANVVQYLKDAYDQLDEFWQKDTDAFLQLMLRDGCFVLEILRSERQALDDYAPNDPIFSNHGKLYIMPYIRRDMLMLENQLPMLVLDTLVAVETDAPKKKEDLVNRLVLKFCSPSAPPTKNMGRCLRVLDVHRKGFLFQDPRWKHHHGKTEKPVPHDGDEIIWSATELHEAGIRFNKSKTQRLKDIAFHRGVLRLPVVVVDDTIESMFLNQIAFERYHVGAGNEVTSYIFFMVNLTDSARDVSLLHSHGIIQNALGSDKSVAKLFNSLSKDITLDPENSLDKVHKKFSDYCKKPWNKWRANLIHTYFTNPWAIISLMAATFLFVLAIIQAVYGVLSVYHSSTQ